MRSLISVIGYFIGIIVSHLLGKFFFKSVIGSAVLNSIEDSLIKNLNITKNMENALKDFNFIGNPILESTLGSNIIKIFLNRILFVAVFFSIFSIFRFIKRYILRFTRIMRKLPIFGFFDGFLGALCGVLKAFIFLFIFAIVCFIIIIVTEDKLFFLNNSCVNSTFLFFLFYKVTNFLK